MKRSAFATIVALLFSGCTLGPDYLRPKILIPDNHRGVVGAPVAESLADLPWWELFRDPVLQELTRESLQHNFDLRIAAARVEQARAQIGITRSFLFPQVHFSASGSVQQVSRSSEPPQSFGADRTFRNLLLGFGLAWELDIFG
jgi:multidrug efflux system outer membrane protein